MNTVAALPCRITAAVPRSTAPCAVNSSSRASASARGSSIAWQKCVPAVGTRQDVREEDALIDLDAVLVALHLLALRIDLRARRRQAGHERGGLVGEHVRRARSASGLLVSAAIDRLRVAQHEASRLSRPTRRIVSAARACSGLRFGFSGNAASSS